jgi:hypothetical protein
MIKRLAALLLLAALALLAVGSGGEAEAKKKRRRSDHVVGVSSVTIDFEDREPTIPLPIISNDPDDYFHGKITPVRGCEGRHTVQVQRARGGVVGTTEVSSDGTWRMTREDPGNDSYFAKASGVTVRGAKACSRGTSPVIAVEESDPF